MNTLWTILLTIFGTFVTVLLFDFFLNQGSGRELASSTLESMRERWEDSSSSTIFFSITLLVIATAIYYYIYYRNLRQRECARMNDDFGEMNGNIQNAPTTVLTYGLCDVYLKSAANACNGGALRNDYVDTCVLKAAIKQGVRLIDLEIFSVDDKPVVASSTTESFHFKETFNHVPIEEVLDVLRDYAFSSSMAPNAADPFFVHLRFKSANQKMYKSFGRTLKRYESMLLTPKFNIDSLKSDQFLQTPLNTFSGKVVLMVDQKNTVFLDVSAFRTFVNATTNSVFARAISFRELKQNADLQETIEFNRTGITLVLPDTSGAVNPDNPNGLGLREMGCQLVAMRFAKIDAALEEDQDFFENAKAAIVLKPEKLRIQKLEVKLPSPQDPSLSYASRTVKGDFYEFKI